MLTNSIFNRLRSMFDVVILPKSCDEIKYSNDLTTKTFFKHKDLMDE